MRARPVASIAMAVALALIGCSDRREAAPLESKVRVATGEASRAESTAPSPVATTPVEPCSGDGYAAGPAPSPLPGQPPFSVLFDCLWPSHARLELSLVLTRRAKRSEVETLLRGQWKALEGSMGKGFPESVKLCVLGPGSDLSAAPLGCVRKGYEPEGEPGEDEADLRLDMPVEPAELAASIEAALGGGRLGHSGPRATIREPGTLTLAYPYPQANPTYAEVVLPFFELAWRFYPASTSLVALHYEGTSRGRRVLDVRVRDVAAFLAMDPWGIRQRLDEAHVPRALDAARTPEQEALVQKELQAGLARLPAGSVAASPTLQ